MKILLISDSHGNKRGIDKIFSSVKFDYLFFMGDGLNDLCDYVYLDNVVAVSGNCDFFSKELNEKYLELEGNKILITHGNKYGVKRNLNELIERAKELEVNYVFYGHTHIQSVEEIQGIYFINPGSFYPRSNKESVGLAIEFVENKPKIEKLIV